MNKSIEDIAEELKTNNKRVQLIYAFNGTGKTRLSRAFKESLEVEGGSDEVERKYQICREKVLFTIMHLPKIYFLG